MRTDSTAPDVRLMPMKAKRVNVVVECAEYEAFRQLVEERQETLSGAIRALIRRELKRSGIKVEVRPEVETEE